MEEFWTYLILCFAAFFAGAVNSIAGGGTLLTFPALDGVIGSVGANATSTLALLPGSLAGSLGYRKELAQTRRMTLWLLVPSILGGSLGAYCVLEFGKSTFEQLIPWLILLASTLFLLQPTIARWVRTHPHGEPTGRTLTVILIAQFLISIYGGYFGAGIGILMLSSLAFMGIGDIHHMNAVKTLLAATINFLAAIVFLFLNLVNWKYAIPMAITSILGGYYGAQMARRLKPTYVRLVVIVVGFGVSAMYFAKQWNWI
jgi:uncharacterized protein